MNEAWHTSDFQTSGNRWPERIFRRFSQELWLLEDWETESSSRESPRNRRRLILRRRLLLFFVVLGRAVFGTIRSFIKLQDRLERFEDEKVNKEAKQEISSSTLCSGPFINWIIFLLDVIANCGFLLGFQAGRHYFHFLKKQTESERETESCAFDSLDSSSQESERNDLTPLRRPRARAKDARTERKASRNPSGKNGKKRNESENGKRSKEEENSARLQDLNDGDDPSFTSERGERENSSGVYKILKGPIFLSYSKRFLLAFLVFSALECWSLASWEAGILGNRDDEVDVFRVPAFRLRTSASGTTGSGENPTSPTSSTSPSLSSSSTSSISRPYFQSWTPDFSRWKLRRLILGSWRDVFYFVWLYAPRFPISFSFFFFFTWQASSVKSWKRNEEEGAALSSLMHFWQSFLQSAVTALLSYLVLLGAQRAYFAMSCLLISWECRSLEDRASEFARSFPQLSPRERYWRHLFLTKEVKRLQERLQHMISYVFLQRFAYLALDVARQSCDASLPFNLIHYLFRHVMFLSALAITAWRIGKLNFAIYEKLHNRVMDLLPRNWAEDWDDASEEEENEEGEKDLENLEGSGENEKKLRLQELQVEVVMQRQHMEDWFRYLQHNIDTGRRDACISVFHLRFAAKSHVLALSVLTLLTLPLLNKILEHYGKHVVNDRLVSFQNERDLNEMNFLSSETCAAE